MPIELDLDNPPDWHERATLREQLLAALDVVAEAGKITADEAVMVRMRILDRIPPDKPADPLAGRMRTMSQ